MKQPIGEVLAPGPAGDAHEARSGGTSFAALTLGSIGVVFGDIGTSPL